MTNEDDDAYDYDYDPDYDVDLPKSRRSFLKILGLVALAPFVVRASAYMPEPVAAVMKKAAGYTPTETYLGDFCLMESNGKFDIMAVLRIDRLLHPEDIPQDACALECNPEFVSAYSRIWSGLDYDAAEAVLDDLDRDFRIRSVLGLRPSPPTPGSIFRWVPRPGYELYKLRAAA